VTSPPRIDEVPELWRSDGSFRDVYVNDTNVRDWEKFIEFASAYPNRYTIDGCVASMTSVADALHDRDHAHLLAVWVGGAQINCHFFSEEEIELDLDPREIHASEHDAVLHFVAALSTALGKPALVTEENAHELPLLTYEPRNSAWCNHGKR